MSQPNPRAAWFQEARFGLFIHWGLYALAARHEWVKNHARLSDEQYERYFRHFDPDLYNPRAWARMAAEAGMKYFVVTTKHHEGFCLWDSKETTYSAPHTPCAKDLLRPMVQAFRDEGLRVGFYYSLIDWHHPEFPVDRHHPQREDKAFREAQKGRDVRKYAQYLHAQVRELLSTFGTIDILWCDFSYRGEDGKGHEDWQSEELVRLIRELQPEILLNDRLDLPGSADFVTPEQRMPGSRPAWPDGSPAVWEGCHTFSGSWGYHRDEASWKSVKQLLTLLIDSVSKHGNLLLNVGPTARGEFDLRAQERLAGIGRWMRHHGKAIYGCGESAFRPPEDCRYTQRGQRLYLHLLNWPLGAVHLPGLANKVAYAQLLHDGSEVAFSNSPGEGKQIPPDSLSLKLPMLQPAVEVPVVELFLKE